jgi:hypothetical protein
LITQLLPQPLHCSALGFPDSRWGHLQVSGNIVRRSIQGSGVPKRLPSERVDSLLDLVHRAAE